MTLKIVGQKKEYLETDLKKALKTSDWGSSRPWRLPRMKTTLNNQNKVNLKIMTLNNHNVKTDPQAPRPT